MGINKAILLPRPAIINSDEKCSREKRVGRRFRAEGRGVAVSGIDHGFRRQRQQLLADGLNQLLVRPSAQIGAADTARKDRVAAKEYRGRRVLMGLGIEGDASRCVTWRVNDDKANVSDAEFISIGQ